MGPPLLGAHAEGSAGAVRTGVGIQPDPRQRHDGLDYERADAGMSFGQVDEAWYRAMNPNGTVPTIRDGGFVLWESNAIVQYLGMKYGPALFYGNDIERFASASRWMLWENNELISPMHNYVKHTIRFPEEQRDPKIVAASREQLIAAWGIVDGELGKTRYIAGDDWSMGDIPMTIRVHRWHLLQVDAPDFPNISRYYDDLSG